MKDTIILGKGNWTEDGGRQYQTVVFNKAIADATVRTMESATDGQVASFVDCDIAIDRIIGNVVVFSASKVPSIPLPVELVYSEIPESINSIVMNAKLTDAEHFEGNVGKSGLKKLKQGNVPLIVNIGGDSAGIIKFPSLYYDRESNVFSATSIQVKDDGSEPIIWGLTVDADGNIKGQTVQAGGGGTAKWGLLTGNIEEQADLITRIESIINDTLESPTTTWSSDVLKARFAALAGVATIKVVPTRPDVGVLNTMYYVGEASPYHIWLFAKNEIDVETWFDMGTTEIDLSGYLKTEDADSTFIKKSQVDGITIKDVDDVVKTSIGGCPGESTALTVVKSASHSWGAYGNSPVKFSDYRGKPGETVTVAYSAIWGGTDAVSGTFTRTIRDDGLFDKFSTNPPYSRTVYSYQFDANGGFYFYANGDYMTGTCTMSIQIKSTTKNFQTIDYSVVPIDTPLSFVKKRIGIADGAIAGAKLADKTVSNAKIADGAINNAKIANSTIEVVKMAANAVSKTIAEKASAVDTKFTTEKAVRTLADGIKVIPSTEKVEGAEEVKSMKIGDTSYNFSGSGGTGDVTKEYVDEQDANNLQSAKDYADEKDGETLTTAEGYTDTKAGETLQSAKDYTDTKAGETLQSAKDYADEKDGETLTTAEDYADTKAGDAETNANGYTDTKVGAIIDDASESTEQTWSASVLKTKFSALSGAASIKVVATKPETGELNTLYYVGNASPYHIWLYAKNDAGTGAWFDMGTTEIDLGALLKRDGTNNITASIMSETNITFKRKGTSGEFTIYGGENYDDGAIIAVRGKDAGSGLGGVFLLDANDGTNKVRLLGKPDGTFTWGDKNILIEGDVYSKDEIDTFGGTLQTRITYSMNQPTVDSGSVGDVHIQYAIDINGAPYLVQLWVRESSGWSGLDATCNAHFVDVVDSITAIEDEIGEVGQAGTIRDDISKKSAVSVSDTGTATEIVKYIEVDGTEKKLPKGLDEVGTGTAEPSGGSDGDWYFQYEA